jgi:hypothetical protein
MIFNGEPAEAEPVLLQLLAVRKATRGDDDQHTINTLYNLGMALYNQEKYGEAAAVWLDVRATSTRVLGPDHHQTLGVLDSLANARDNPRWCNRVPATFHGVTMSRHRSVTASPCHGIVVSRHHHVTAS